MLQERPGRSRTKSEAARPNRHPMQEPRHADKELDNFMAPRPCTGHLVVKLHLGDLDTCALLQSAFAQYGCEKLNFKRRDNSLTVHTRSAYDARAATSSVYVPPLDADKILRCQLGKPAVPSNMVMNSWAGAFGSRSTLH